MAGQPPDAGPGGGGGAGPPPSTLAAQLVENISASSKSARSDDNAELKGLFAVIQRVKDDPELLRTPEQRTEHNHMLVYVYCRVVLDAIRLDDPLLNQPHVRAESLKALNFLRFTINETPAVVCYASASHGLLFRGGEPLWVWLLPQWLRMLGHPKLKELESAIEGFLQYLLLTVARVSRLWQLVGPLGMYYRGCLTGRLFLRHWTYYLLTLMFQGLSRSCSYRLSIFRKRMLRSTSNYPRPTYSTKCWVARARRRQTHLHIA